MGFLTSDQILATKDQRKTAIVDTPEWGGCVIVIELSGKQRDAFEGSMLTTVKGKQEVDIKNLRAKLCARTIVNPDDFDIDYGDNGVPISATLKNDHVAHRMFTDIQAHDLGDTSASALQRVFKVAQQLSGIAESDVEEMIETLKNDPSADVGIA